MSGKVYANGNEVVRKGGDGKVTAAFPDVCMSPPPPPAGPVPVPYPDSSSAKDLKAGSRTVQIAGKEVALQDASFYQSSQLGNEAATRNFGASVVTHTITGKTYFASWSMDVKVEGKSVVRHMDLTTSNHGSYPGATPPFSNLSESKLAEAQELAQQRMDAGECPCCGKDDCPAAFRDDDEALTLEEFYGLDKNPSRREQFDFLVAYKRQHCTCDGRVLPEPPCDVFRASEPGGSRHRQIESRWNAEVMEYRRLYMRRTGVRLKEALEILDELLQATGRSQALRATAKMSNRELAALEQLKKSGKPYDAQLMEDAKEYRRLSARSKGLARINHLVPKEASGCPTNPGNLQPQQFLCDACQGIDDFFTAHWQGK
ncbi:PAAR-like domain-containing protein [Myxococcus sp. RHSTA-1-4]|uniref:PAAR-like domain-containing protein n=1 Tax=Myxococcus sp. RHSTA-1-4 TaxID=2874601 RepID=UPI001CC1B66A|nr:PAAR-like domain-containing protein [Myxococcus sp. RHSTA-1-4]MBZ4420402.1 DUF4150 domain-containing protein [Myxococcus sp. RHSTA-1-4]